jgi:hypothetical protein
MMNGLARNPMRRTISGFGARGDYLRGKHAAGCANPIVVFTIGLVQAARVQEPSSWRLSRPPGKSLMRLSSPYCKNNPVLFLPKSLLHPSPSRPHKGRIAIVTDVGCGMRWTRHVKRRMTLRADGEVVWS